MLARTLGLVLPLGIDTFVVAAALGAAGAVPGRAGRFRVSLMLASFEAGMPLVGLALGTPLGRLAGTAADYIGAAVLLGLGIQALVGTENDERIVGLASARGGRALLLGLSVSLDELAIGFTLGLLGAPVGLVLLWIAVQALLAAQLGMNLGRRMSEAMREGAERVAGIALITVALVLLGEKLS